MALIEIEVLHSDDDRRRATLKQVIDQLGPPDGTVIVNLESDGEFSDDLVDEIIDTFGDFGEIILVRYCYFFICIKQLILKLFHICLLMHYHWQFFLLMFTFTSFL